MNFTYFFLLCDMGMESLNSASLLLDGAPLDNPSLGGPRLIKGNPHIFKLSGLCHLFQGMRCDDFIHLVTLGCLGSCDLFCFPSDDGQGEAAHNGSWRCGRTHRDHSGRSPSPCRAEITSLLVGVHLGMGVQW